MSVSGEQRGVWAKVLRWVALPASGVFLALAIAACGGSSGGDETSSPSAQNGGASSSAAYRMVDDKTLIGPHGKSIAIQPGAVTGFIDSVVPGGGSINLTGWAAAPGFTGPAQHVVALVAGESIGEAVPSSKRPDVVEAYGAAAIEKSGFALFVKPSSLECDAPAGGLTVLGIDKGLATSLPLVGDSTKELDAAC